MKDLKEVFKDEFESACSILLSRFPEKEDEERNIVGTVIINTLHQFKCDAEKLCFIDLYNKYFPNTLFLSADDFTATETLKIIEEAPLSDRDKKLSKMYWVDLLSEDEISSKLMIDRKTVRNNIPKISLILKKTASKVTK